MKKCVPSAIPPPKTLSPPTLSREDLVGGIIGLARLIHLTRKAMAASNPGMTNLQ